MDRSTFCMMGATTLCRNIYDSGLSSFREFLIMLIAQLYVKIDLLLTYGKHLNDRVISLERWVWAHNTTIVVSNTYCVVFMFCFSSSYVLYVASFSGLSVFDCPFGILSRLFNPATFYWSSCTKSRKWAVMYIHASGLPLALFLRFFDWIVELFPAVWYFFVFNLLLSSLHPFRFHQLSKRYSRQKLHLWTPCIKDKLCFDLRS